MHSKKTLVYNATIVEREDITDTLAIFRVVPDPSEGQESVVPEFDAGQYAVLGLDNIEDPDKGYVRRAYSIASPPTEKRYLEFYIRYILQPTSLNPLTHLLWKLQKNDRIWLGPKIIGKFTLRDTIGDDDPRFRLFVAAGTGLAPFVSMIRQLQDQGGHADNLALLHGASHATDIGYQKQLETFLNVSTERYFPTVSRPQQSPNWKGDQGRVETFFDDENLADLEHRMGLTTGYLTPETAVIYICGLQGTIAQTLIRMFRRGFVPNDRRIRHALNLPDHLIPSIFFEQYDSAPILDLGNSSLIESIRQTLPSGL